ncbi:MAG: dihydrofolate reductase [Ancalomicrobiaceae bacterium]|nr:dihydrofolate reductase [Ancalomicrobiaceae bacterium]
MADIVVYIAHSVDGFIADRAGGLDFLKPFEGYDFGYDAFFAKIDAVVMGANTYRDCRTFGEWPYPGRSTIVMTKGPPIDGDGYAVFDDRTPPEIVEDLIHAGRRRVFVVGGGGVVRAFIDARLVKKLILFQIPVILGGGAALWPPGRRKVDLVFVHATAHRNGVVETEYEIG